MKKLITIALAMFIAAGLISGCGGNTPEENAKELNVPDLGRLYSGGYSIGVSVLCKESR